MGLKRMTRQRTPASAPCPHCGRAFARNDSLIRHLKTHTSHVEERPFHRIINEKFRACDHCRRSKIRCTGDIPCARCDALHKTCSYQHKNTTGQTSSPPPSASTQEPSTLKSTASPASSTRDEVLDLDASDQLLLDVSAVTDDEPAPKTTSTVVVSSPESTRSLLPLLSVGGEDAHTSFFAFDKDFTLTKSTCVSPTFHILDPYSYKLPSIADSRELSTLGHNLWGIATIQSCNTSTHSSMWISAPSSPVIYWTPIFQPPFPAACTRHVTTFTISYCANRMFWTLYSPARLTQPFWQVCSLSLL